MKLPSNIFPAFWLVLATACTVTLGGCRLCADCDLDSYPSYGGSWQRTVRDSGRVGSVFDPGGSRAADLSERIDAESAEAFNRTKDGKAPQEDKPEAESPENTEESPLDDEERLKQMEDRLLGLELQDINHQEPQDGGQDWR
ncbi:hypothetical protein [Neorhodopirellula pilleata]|uniref:Secreted protein n=1 Tax=Neorhodopirellula pilleata TaxID=2714738 RepID=A0A5C6AS15_9BACT|nr:hypothetical protein [Neorhodopirellula pilleata]TWU02049.1 hypothetical protein Pla100_17880 [Neorhodopirellula pilleata]